MIGTAGPRDRPRRRRDGLLAGGGRGPSAWRGPAVPGWRLRGNYKSTDVFDQAMPSLIQTGTTAVALNRSISNDKDGDGDDDGLAHHMGDGTPYCVDQIMYGCSVKLSRNPN